MEAMSLPRHVARGRQWAAFAAAWGLASVIAHGADAASGPTVGTPAPVFSGVDSNGVSHALADFRGQIVVLEWTNDGCPFVRRHYESGHMQALQKEMTDADVVWLSVISSAPGEQGYVDGAEANMLTDQRGAAPTAVILDPSGEIGHLYNAKTTPHMYVINPEGVLVYMGAIDNEPRNWGADPHKAENYVREAVAAVQAGTPVPTPVTQAYGCTVKYQ